MKKILIAGDHSYIGDSFRSYVEQDNALSVDIITVKDDNWKSFDMSGYDAVVYVAGIVHQKRNAVPRELYYQVNRDLTIEVAKKAKAEGVRQFIFLSTMSVYGLDHGVITDQTAPKPVTDYGRSKLEAEYLLEQLADGEFRVAILRPPMIYGKGCKGNYQSLRKLILSLPVFPAVNNQRSMLYIENLCAFLKQLIEQEKRGIFFPQHAEYGNTSHMAQLIAEAHGKKLRLSRLFSPALLAAEKADVRLIRKAFGSLIYECGDRIAAVDFAESIRRTEAPDAAVPRTQIRNEPPLVSIVTASFQSEKTVRQTIESVLHQTYPNIEYILADGGSTDRTLEIAAEYQDAFREKGYGFRVISGKDSGIYGGMNKGIRAASGKVIGIVNSDDFYYPYTVQTVMERYEAQPFDLLYGTLSIADEAGNEIRRKPARRMDGYMSTRNWNHPTMFVSTDIYRNRLYDESFQYYADWDMALWIYAHSDRITVLPEPLSHYRLGGTSTRADWHNLNAKVRERYRAYRNNGCSRFYAAECFAMEYGKDAVMRLRKWRGAEHA